MQARSFSPFSGQKIYIKANDYILRVKVVRFKLALHSALTAFLPPTLMPFCFPQPGNISNR